MPRPSAPDRPCADRRVAPVRDGRGRGLPACCALVGPGPAPGSWLRRHVPGLLGALLLLLGAPTARAQDLIARYLPADVPGFGTAPGVTVASRIRPLYQPLGLRFGLIAAHPRLDLGFGYDSDATGLAGGKGSWLIDTAPSLALGAAWDRDRIGAFFSLDDRRAPGQAAADRTDGTAAAGARLHAGMQTLHLAAARMALHEDGSEVGALPTDRPVPFTLTTLRAADRLRLGRLSLTPSLGLTAWRYGAASLGGVALAQTYRDRDVLAGGVRADYALAGRESAVLVLRGLRTRYIAPQAGAPSRDSTGLMALAGFDDAADGLWHERLLLGWETRAFAAPQYRTHSGPIVAAEVSFSPDGMTTLTAALSRRIEDAAQEGVAGYTATSARLALDQEMRRNLLLHASAALTQAAFLQGGGTETGTTFAASLTWLLNRRMRVVADERLTTLHAAPVAGAAGGGNTLRSVSLVTLGFGW